MRKKRVLSFVLALFMAVSFFQFFGYDASAAAGTTYKYDTTKQLCSISPEALKIIRAVNNNCSAVKINNTWYYQFKKGNNKVLIKPTALEAEKATNASMAGVNKNLTKGVLNGTATTSQYVHKKAQLVLKGLINYYVWDLNSFSITGQRSDTNVTLQATMNNAVIIYYYDKVRLANGKCVRPRNAKEYKSRINILAAKATTNSYKPAFKVDVKQAGSNLVRLDKCQYAGRGKLINKKQPVDQYIEIAFTTGKIVASLAADKLPVSDAYKLYNQCVALAGDGGEYLSRKTIFLTKYNKKNQYCQCLSSKFKSPVKLTNLKDYTEVTLWLNKEPSINKNAKVKTNISVSFTLN